MARQRTTKFKVYSLMVLLILSTLISCTEPALTTGSKTATTTTQTQIQPKMGGVLKLNADVDVGSLDPNIAGAATERAISALWGNTLVTWRGKSDEEVTIAPSLAKSWDITSDGLNMTFHLREGVKWQNIPPVNGREMTSEDVKFTYDRVRNPKFRYAPYFSGVTIIERYVG